MKNELLLLLEGRVGKSNKKQELGFGEDRYIYISIEELTPTMATT